MKIPNNYDTNKTYGGDFERLTPGGHKCVIRQVEETRSKSGKAMLIVSFDTSPEDTQPNYFSNQYINDKRDDKKWPGNMYIVLEGEYAENNLNKFISAIDHSNENFRPAPGGDVDPRIFANMKVGIIFREEEYNNQNGEVRTAVKGAFWCGYDKALEEKAPKRKDLPRSASDPTNFTPSWLQSGSDYGFVNVADGLQDEGLPFN